MQQQGLVKTLLILLILTLLVVILVFAKPFLVPLTFAAILAMLLLPLTKWLEGRGMARGLAIIVVLLFLLALLAGLGYFFSWQLSDIGDDTAKMKEQAAAKLQDLETYISNRFGLSVAKQQELIRQQQEKAPDNANRFIAGVLSSLGSFVTNIVLVLVYIFLMLFFRNHLKASLLKFIPPAHQETGKEILHDTLHVTQRYLTGLSLMIVCLWVLYGIGFSIVGIKNALFFAVLCGFLEIVPFVGNLTGTLLTLGMAIVQGGSTGMLIGVVATYAAVQFLQTYILEPLVVGSEVNINPLFIIMGIVGGELVWGIPGMILSIPILGIAKIICDGVPVLQPIGYLIGTKRKKKSRTPLNGLKDRLGLRK